MKKSRLFLFHLLLLLAACAFCRLIISARRKAAAALHPVHRDTLIIRDTLRIDRPVPVREKVVRYVTVK
ncbi:secreted protein, partial [gut metagenome]